MVWEGILDAVDGFADGVVPDTGQWAQIVDSACTSGLFPDVDARIAARAGIVVLTLDPSLDFESCAASVRRLGPPLSLDVVSPPIRDPQLPDRRPLWDRKHGVCHVRGTRKVWFGLEQIGEVERLVSTSIHYEEERGTDPLSSRESTGPRSSP